MVYDNYIEDLTGSKECKIVAPVEANRKLFLHISLQNFTDLEIVNLEQARPFCFLSYLVPDPLNA